MEKIKINWIFHAVFYFISVRRIQSSEILVIFPTTAQSHYRVIQPLIHGLLDRGHKILSITNFPDATERANLSHINISGIKSHSKFKTSDNNLLNSLSRVVGNINTYAAVLDHPPISNLLKSGRKFDLVIAEFFTTTSIFAPIAAVVHAPIIGFCPMITFPWIDELMGVQTMSSYMPNIFSSNNYSSFIQRLSNSVISVLLNQLFDWFYTSKVQKINKHHYDISTESLMESMANISLIFTNNYHSMFMALPRVPGIIDVGGIHVVDEKPLPQELNDFINHAEYGVILFSLGSVVSESSISEDKLHNIFNTFSRVKQRIIMKFDTDIFKTRLPNVKIVKWFPQRDLLAHPKVILFISHAGIMSVIETIHCGKPMVAIPIFGDQPFNAKFLVEKQVAVTIDYNQLKSNELFNAINKTLTENYRTNAKNLQKLYNDRPQSPLNTTIYWTEYVIRNKNEVKNVLKSPKIHLNLYQTYLIDIFAIFVLPIIIAISITCWAIVSVRKNVLCNFTCD